MESQQLKAAREIDGEETSQSSSATDIANEQPENNSLATDIEANGECPSTTTPQNPRLQALLTKKANLETTLASLQAQRSDLVAQARLSSGAETETDSSEEDKAKAALASADVIIRNHIALLQKYNEIKDIGQGLMGLITEERNVRIGTVMEEFGMSEKD